MGREGGGGGVEGGGVEGAQHVKVSMYSRTSRS